jgi:hypothetical protein
MFDPLEHRSEPLLPRPAFALRLLRYSAIAGGIIGFSLAIGMVGYSTLAGFGWVDAFLNAAMILGGMGPIGDLESDTAKVFAGLYALFCGVVLLASVSILLTPIIHRVQHRLHLELERDTDSDDDGDRVGRIR